MKNYLLHSYSACVKYHNHLYSIFKKNSVIHFILFCIVFTEETQWLPDEVQVLITLWAQPNIQKQLLSTSTNNQVFTYLSNELALVGFNKTPHQCSIKVNNLKEEYKKIKEINPHVDVKSDWFAILDSVLSPVEYSTEVDSTAVLTQPKSPEQELLRTVWTSDEVKVLLTRWADESIQEQLRSTQRNERVFAQLSSELATQGFDKTTSQCRSKIRLLRRKYERIKGQKDYKKQRSRWFTLMDKVIGHQRSEAEMKQAAEAMDSASATLQTSQHDLCETVEETGKVSMSFFKVDYNLHNVEIIVIFYELNKITKGMIEILPLQIYLFIHTENLELVCQML